MITFKQYLSEELLTEGMVKKWFSRDIDVDTAISVLNSSAKLGLEAIKNGGLIFRGFSKVPKSSMGFVALDSSEGRRTSRDTDNLYQLMMADSRKMDGYPDRSNSFICTTSATAAKSYGGTSNAAYVMVPLDGTKIAVSNVDDIFSIVMTARTFYTCSPNYMYDLSAFFRTLGAKMQGSKWISSDVIKSALKGHSKEKLLLHWALFVSERSMLKFKDKKLQDKWKDIKQYGWVPESIVSTMHQTLNEMEKEMKNGRFEVKGKLADAYKFIQQNSKDLYTALATELVDPAKMKLKLIDYGQSIPPNRECWFSGKCIAISFPVFAKILLRLEEQGFPIHVFVRREMKTELENEMKMAKEKEKK